MIAKDEGSQLVSTLERRYAPATPAEFPKMGGRIAPERLAAFLRTGWPNCPEYTSEGKGLVGEYTLDDLEDVLGYIAAEANHTDDKRLCGELDALYHQFKAPLMMQIETTVLSNQRWDAVDGLPEGIP